MSDNTTIPVPFGDVGTSLYVRIRRRADGQFWNKTTPAFEAWNPAHITDYAVLLSDVDGVGFYTATFPDAITAGVYDLLLFEYFTAPTTSDDPAGSGEVEWDGAKFVRINGVPTAVLDQTNAVDGYSLRQLFRLAGAVLLGKVSGANTGTEVFRAADDSKVRVTATVTATGNRTAVTKDAT